MLRKLIILSVLSLCFLANAAAYGTLAFDHQYPKWSLFLSEYVTDGRVDYQRAKENRADLINAYEEIAAVQKKEYDSWTDKQKIAFWLNSYNVGAILSVVEFYPFKKGLNWKALAYPENSIQQIPDVWDRPVFVLLREKTSLGKIEHEILRERFKEPRIHFALVCASIGCPKLRAEPYVPERLEEQLDEQVRVFMSDTAKARYEQDNDTLYLSPILKWFGDDFEAGGGRVAFVKKYLPNETAVHLSGKTNIKWLDYDWSLNERKVNP